MTAAASAQCALCGLDCGRHPVPAREDAEEHVFCCTGCAQVHAILSETGVLASGQDFRDTDLFRESLRLGLISRPQQDKCTASAPPANAREVVFQLDGMWCSACGWLIEHAVQRLRGVVSAEVFFASDLLKVRYSPRFLPLERIIARVGALGYTAREYRGSAERDTAARRDLLLRMGIAAFLWINVMTLSMALYVGYFERIADSVARYLPFVLMALSAPAVFYCAWPLLRVAAAGLRVRAVRMETLLALGIVAAWAYGAIQAFRGGTHFYFDTACAIVTLVLAGKIAEQSAKEKTARALTLLYRMMPKKARLRSNGRERYVSADALEHGTVFIVQPGERLPADGIIVEGHSHVDESVLTGESSPRSRAPGDRVVCGSVNGSGVLAVRATQVGSESTLAQIICAVEQALGSRTQVERQVDRISRVFVPAVMAIAVLTVAGWLLAGAGGAAALLHGITVLVIACPCALGIATPLAITSAIGTASRKGILIRNGAALESTRRIDTVVLDKTGTITEGDFALLEIAGDERVLLLVASLESYSQHPLGRALRRWAEAQGHELQSATEIEILEGVGIRGIVAGRAVFAGNRAICPHPPAPALEQQVARWSAAGHTAIYFGIDGAVAGAIAFGDRIKPDAQALVAALQSRGIQIWLVSGDAPQTVDAVARQIGIDRVRAGVLPGEKTEMVRKLQRQGSVVAMIGDGVNDAPALAQADLGIALGSGTDIAMDAAPVVVMNGRLALVPEAFALAEQTLRVVRQNLFWAFFYNIVGITLAVSGVLNPIAAAAAMVLSSTSVILNSRRHLLRPAEVRA